jgi:galactokinase
LELLVSNPADYLKEVFPERYPSSGTPKLVRAPGRVNLIGEHTDYSEGFVMPIAIDLACFAAAAPSSERGMFRIYSEDLLQGSELPVEEIAVAKPHRQWVDYVLGVAQQLVSAGREVAPCDLLVHSTVPVGAGLSSSAALEVSSALALGAGSMDKVELARLCQRAENEFVGLPCGIMDQFVSVFGEEHAAILIDCRTLKHQAVPLPENVSIVAVNSMVKHELGSSAYRERVAECAQAVAFIRASHPQVKTLRDATLEMLDPRMGDVVLRRARHVISEDNRVLEFAAASKSGDLKRMGELFVQSHRSLQHDYEVSCAELDFLVDTALTLPGVYGARMTGGGFGGCTVNLLDPAQMGSFRDQIAARYKERFGIDAQVFECRPSAGAGPV